jgi:hypothetical protein
MKSLFTVLMLTAFAGLLPSAQAQTVRVNISGSSALWQTLALGAFGVPAGTSGQGTCSSQLGADCTGPTFHWTSPSSGANEPYLNDSRSGTANLDPGPVWVVWDSAATPNVWVFTKVDSVVGDRCYFGKCRLFLNAASNTPAGSNLITVWNNTGCTSCDTTLPTAIGAILNAGLVENGAATDIRPEDAAFAAARVNSALGASTISGGAGPLCPTPGSGASDCLDGLGYNANNPAGVPPVYPAGTSKGVGSPILSGQPGSTQQANVLAFNITGKDPFTNTAVPAYTVTAVGASPIVFVTSRSQNTGLKNVTNASELQLQQVFSGSNCDATAFGVSGGTGLNIMLREPLSGTYNTTEATVMRHPTVYPNPVLGLSMETGVGTSNPLKGQGGTCTTAGTGARYRGIGTGEVVKGVSISNTAGQFTTAQDGIAYTFFSYGNVKSLAGSNSFGYIQLDGVDPIFASYSGNIDPGQPTQASQGGLNAGSLPLNTPCGTGSAAFPCQESAIWANGFSFPNVRNGNYRAWSLLRVISTGTANTALGLLVKASQAYVVAAVPDYIPYVAVTCSASTHPACSPTVSDLGLKLLRSHYEQEDGNGVELGAAGVATNSPEKGGDMGGIIIPNTIGVTTYKQVQVVTNSAADGGFAPVVRP